MTIAGPATDRATAPVRTYMLAPRVLLTPKATGSRVFRWASGLSDSSMGSSGRQKQFAHQLLGKLSNILMQHPRHRWGGYTLQKKRGTKPWRTPSALGPVSPSPQGSGLVREALHLRALVSTDKMKLLIHFKVIGSIRGLRGAEDAASKWATLLKRTQTFLRWQTLRSVVCYYCFLNCCHGE